MKYGILFALLAPSLMAGVISAQITFKGEPLVSLRTILQGFSNVGYKLEIDSFEAKEGSGELIAKIVTNKPFNPGALNENLKEQSINVEFSQYKDQKLTMTLATQSALWSVPLMGSDEGSEVKKTVSPQWFRVEEAQHIRIEPPYAGKWYPDVAVLDSKMNVLSSFRSSVPKEEMVFELPSGAYYLKVSNAPGMKVLKEGMWIESMSPGR